MKFTLLTIVLITMTQAFEITMKQEISIVKVQDDRRVEECVNIAMGI